MTDSRSELMALAARVASVSWKASYTGIVLLGHERDLIVSALRLASSQPDSGVLEREAHWLVERVGTGLYVKNGSVSGTYSDLTDNVWHAERFKNERAAFDFARLCESPWAKELKATEHLFINQIDRPTPPQPDREMVALVIDPESFDDTTAVESSWRQRKQRHAFQKADAILLLLVGGVQKTTQTTKPTSSRTEDSATETALRAALEPLMRIVNKIAWCHDIDGLIRARKKVNAALAETDAVAPVDAGGGA